jgi:hypothetical protein
MMNVYLYVQVLEKEKKNAENSVDLFQTRLASQNELMALQEKELSKVVQLMKFNLLQC